jgi:hypothetical protein
MPIPSKELFEYLVGQGYKKSDGGVLAEHMRRFIREFYHETRTTPAMMYALWESFKQTRDSVKNISDLDDCKMQFVFVEEDGNLWRYNTKKKKWSEVKDSYFRNIVNKAWKTYIDNDGIQWVHLEQQKKLRLRKQKV